MKPRFFIWTGGQPGNPEDGPRVETLPSFPDPDPLPRSALITYWWGKTRFEIAAYACSVRTTPWGDEPMTWLHCKAAEVSAIKSEEPPRTMTRLIPAHYVTEVTPGPTFQINQRGTSGDIGLFPPNQPAPPHALPLPEIERALAGLSEWPTAAGWGFSITYPLFALKRESGDYVGFDSRKDTAQGVDWGIPVFTTEASATKFRAHTRTQARITTFERVAVFRRFLRSIRDAGTFILFDPCPGQDQTLYADHTYPAAVVLEQFLPEVAWGWSYPVYVLRFAPGLACIDGNDAGTGLSVAIPLPNSGRLVCIDGDHAGTLVKVLVVFTDSDLADRAIAAAPEPMIAEPVADAEEFARLVRNLPTDVAGVVFDPPDPVRGAVAKTVIFRDTLLANLENMEI